MDLAEHLEREPTAHELASALGVADEEFATFMARTQPRQLISFDEMSENERGEESLPLTERLADPGAERPDARMRSEEEKLTLLKCLNRLPKSQLTVVVLHYLQGIPLREVARLLAVTPSRVSQLHRQALVRLKLAWETATQTA